MFKLRIFSFHIFSGSSDTTVKIYDLDKQYYTHSFKGSEESVT